MVKTCFVHEINKKFEGKIENQLSLETFYPVDSKDQLTSSNT